MKPAQSDLVTDSWIVGYLTAVTPWPPCDRAVHDGCDFVWRVNRWIWWRENVSAPVLRGDIKLA